MFKKFKIRRTTILPVDLYGSILLSLTTWEDNPLRVFENNGLRRMPGSEEEETAGDWRKLLIEEIHDLYFSAGIILLFISRMMMWRGMDHSWENERNLVRQLDIKRRLRRHQMRE